MRYLLVILSSLALALPFSACENEDTREEAGLETEQEGIGLEGLGEEDESVIGEEESVIGEEEEE